MNEKGHFSISILTDQQGFPLDSASAAGEDADTQSAVVALVQKTAVLYITHDDEEAVFYFHEGTVVHAQLGRQTGK